MNNKKILITGANGFIGKNLTVQLLHLGYTNLYLCDRETTLEQLDEYCKDCQFVFHLAGVNRPTDPKEFYEGNTDFSKTLLTALKNNNNTCPIIVTSSMQAFLENDYGISKRMGENVFFENSQNQAYIFRLHGVFGKWSMPNYNTVVATFCYNVAHNIPLTVNDPSHELTLCYIDDVVAKFIFIMEKTEFFDTGFYEIDTIHHITLGELANTISLFGKNRETLVMPSMMTLLEQRLYGTYLSYLDTTNLSYPLKKNEDDRGWLSEFIKNDSFGQIFISTTKPGITRGNHYHHTKIEKFFVIKGKGEISFRNILTNEAVKYIVDGENPTVLDIPVGYTHKITNIGDDELITLFWTNQVFNPALPDTYFSEV